MKVVSFNQWGRHFATERRSGGPWEAPVSYPERHKYVTLHGQLWRGSAQTEEWQIGVRYTDGGVVGVSQAMANAVDAAVRSRWTTSLGVLISNPVAFTHVKVAPIGIDGRYPSAEVAYESTHTVLAALGSSSLAPWPGQCAIACTLMTNKASQRGRAARGRVYLPPLSTTIDTTGRISTSTATSVATAVANLLRDIATAIGGGSQPWVYSDVALGEGYPINRVRVGTVVDTIRRRRRQLLEVPPTPVAVP